MKKKIIITVILFIFSILYIKNASYIIRENDILMKEIKSKQNNYYIKPINAIITEHIIIPSINGKKVNVKKSYNNMKGINKFNESLLIFDSIKPSKTIDNIYNKVVLFHPKENIVSIITSLDNNYCYTENLSISDECIDEKKHTILIHRISNNHLSYVKKNLRNGIVFFLDSINKNELNLVIKYIKNNNYNILTISELMKTHDN